LDSDAIQDLARDLSRAEFVGRFRLLFLAVKQDEPDENKISFTTAVVDFDSPEMKRHRPHDWEVFALVKARGNPYPDRISVGRARNCDLVMRDPTVSKLHAHFRSRTGGGYDLVDLDSPNGTRVNQVDLKPNQPHPVKSGDAIRFGLVNAELVDAGRLYDLLQFG
jgi:FHA domain